VAAPTGWMARFLDMNGLQSCGALAPSHPAWIYIV
jgi:hypothetical protein